jgi:hypothetical protein
MAKVYSDAKDARGISGAKEGRGEHGLLKLMGELMEWKKRVVFPN